MDVLRKVKNFPPVYGLSEINHLEIISNAKKKIGVSTHSDRSFAQYYCLTKTYKSKLLHVFREVVVFPIYLLLILYLLLLGVFNSIFLALNMKSQNEVSKAFVIPNSSIIPNKVKTGFDCLIINKQELIPSYKIKDFLLTFKFLGRRVLYPYFSSKCMYKIYTYSGLVKKGCKEIYVSNEYCFTSSILSLYVNAYRAKCINCMHGEKLLNCRDAFCTYDGFYVWDKHYSLLFKQMESKAEFHISSCKATDLITSQKAKIRDTVVYFLQGNEDENDLKKIKKNLTTIKEKYKANHLRIKEHPRYINKLAKSIFPSNFFYCGAAEDIIDSSLVVCGSYTSLLFQVYSSRKGLEYPKIYVNPHRFLIDLNYIMMKKADGFFT